MTDSQQLLVVAGVTLPEATTIPEPYVFIYKAEDVIK